MKEWIKCLFSLIEKITQEEDNLIRFLRMIENINNKKVLDVGCGFGRILKELKKEGINARVGKGLRSSSLTILRKGIVVIVFYERTIPYFFTVFTA